MSTIPLFFLLGIVLTVTIPVKAYAQSKAECPGQPGAYLKDAVSDIDQATQKITVCGSSVVRALKTLLGADSSTNRNQYLAAYALGRMGADASDAVPDLIRALNNKNSQVCAIAAHALGQIGPSAEASVPKLIQLLKTPGENFQASAIRANAAYALGQILQKTQNASLSLIAVPALTKALEDKSENVRANAAYALGQIGSASLSAASALIKALRDDTEKVQANAAYALGQIKPVNQEADLRLVNMLKSRNDNLSNAAAYALGEIKPDFPQILQLLTEATSSKDTNVRINVARLLGQIGLAKQDTQPTIIPTIVQPLIYALENDSSSSVRTVAVQALARINYGEPSLIQAYLNALKQKDSAITAGAAYGLGEVYKGKRIAFASDQTTVAQLKEVTDKLSSFLCNKGDEEVSEDVRIVAVDALGKIYAGTRQRVDRQRVDVLLRAFKDKSTTVRAVAAVALGRVGWSDDRVVLPLFRVVLDSKEDTVVRLIGLEALKNLAKDSDNAGANNAGVKLAQLEKAGIDNELKNEQIAVQLLSTNRPPVDEIVKCIQSLLRGRRC